MTGIVEQETENNRRDAENAEERVGGSIKSSFSPLRSLRLCGEKEEIE